MDRVNVVETNLDFTGPFSYRSETNRIFIHHTSGNDYDYDAETIHGWHIYKEGWIGIGYHFVVRKDGTIERGRPVDVVGSHAYQNNSDSIGIHLSGNFMIATPTEAQIESTALLIANLCTDYNLPFDRSHILGHREVNDTDCPGDNLYEMLEDIVAKASSYADGTASSSGKIILGYLVTEGGLDGSLFDPKYIDYHESRPGATDLKNVRPEVVAAFNGLAKQACENGGGKLLITGAAETTYIDENGKEKHYHATGEYGHEGGWKLDVDPESVANSCGQAAFLELCQQYGCAAGDEENHYDLAFHSKGGVGGTLLVEPPKYLSDMYGGKTVQNPNSSRKNTKLNHGESQYEGFDIKPVGKDYVKITKLPKGKTYCEPIYPDLIMVGDFVPKWALDPAAEVTNVGDDSMIQWGKSNNKTSSSSGNDSSPGGAGNDSSPGGSGNDTVPGGAGNESSPGGNSGQGNDTTTGGTDPGTGGNPNPGSGNNDTIPGGGNDSTPGGSGTPSLPGGEIPHTIYFPEDNKPKNLNGLNLDDMIIWG